MLKGAQIGKLRVEIGHDLRVAQAVATPGQAAFDGVCCCSAQDDVVEWPGKCRKGRKPVRTHDAVKDDEVALHAFYDVADTLADDVLVGDLSCLNVENSIDPDSGAFLAGDNAQRLNPATSAGFLMGID